MNHPPRPVRLTDPVTDRMGQDFTQLRASLTVGEALSWLRQHPPPGRVVYFYVTDDDGRLLGVVPTRRLLLSPPDRLLADIMVGRVVALPADATVLDACEFFTLHRFLAFPVVDDQQRLVGVVDVDLYTDELSGLGDGGQDGSGERERDSDLFQMIGVHLAEARPASLAASLRRRLPWLLCN